MLCQPSVGLTFFQNLMFCWLYRMPNERRVSLVLCVMLLCVGKSAQLCPTLLNSGHRSAQILVEQSIAKAKAGIKLYAEGAIDVNQRGTTPSMREGEGGRDETSLSWLQCNAVHCRESVDSLQVSIRCTAEHLVYA